MLKGIKVTLYERTQNGVDAFGVATYNETPVSVENVLVAPVVAEGITDSLRLYGKKAEYELCLPKGDAHAWDDCRVDFFGQRFRVFGPAKEWIEDMVPLDWNKKIMVERYE